MLQYLSKKKINIDKKFIYHNVSRNKKNVTFFYLNKKIHLINNLSFKKHNHFQSWRFICSRIFGFNKKVSSYLLQFYGYNKNVIFTDLDEFYFILFKSFLKNYSDYLSLSWFLLYLKQRSFLLPLLFRGVRYLKKLPSRGQRTCSNYNTNKNRKDNRNYFTFKKKLTNHYKSVNYPGWKQIKSFYFHKF